MVFASPKKLCFSFLAKQIQNGKNKYIYIVWFFFFFGVLSFQLPKFYIMLKFEIDRLAKNLRRMPNLFILLSY